MFLSSIWQALPKPSPLQFLGSQAHVALEIVGGPSGVHVQIGVSHATAKRIILGQLAAHFPDVEVAAGMTEFPACAALANTELGLALDRSKGLRTLKGSEPDPQAGIVASLSGLSGSEFGLVQILTRPALVPGFKSLAYEVITRLAAGAPTEQQARSRLAHIVAAFGQFAAENTFRPRSVVVDSPPAFQAIAERRWPMVNLTPLLVEIEELNAVWHPPAPSKVPSPYLKVIAARRLPPPRQMPNRGVRIGLVMDHGRERAVYLDPKELIYHMAVFGGTGGGKTTLLANIATDVIAAGGGLSVIEPHRSLIRRLLQTIPEERLKDVVLLRANDLDFPVGVDLVQAKPGFEFLTVDELVEVVRRVGRDYWGPLLDQALRRAAEVVLEAGGGLLDLARVLDDEQYRASVLPSVSHPATRRYLQRLSSLSDGAREQRVSAAVNRLERFDTPVVRGIVGQRNPKLDLRQVMDESKILLVDLAGVGDSNARLLGSLLTLRFRQAALSRIDTSEAKRRPHLLILDECSWFVTSTIGQAMSDVRKFGLGLILATQHLSQLKPDETRDAIFANLGSLICFHMGGRGDEQALECYFGTAGLTASEIHALGRHEVYAQITENKQRLPAFWARTPAPPLVIRDEQAIQEVLERSRRLYGRPRELIEEDITKLERIGSDDEPERRSRRRPTATD